MRRADAPEVVNTTKAFARMAVASCEAAATMASTSAKSLEIAAPSGTPTRAINKS